jgi:hypothetical protein
MNALCNFVHVCRRCREEIFTAPAESYGFGWLVASWKDPALMPLLTWRADGGLLPEWLTADGRRATEPPDGVL